MGAAAGARARSTAEELTSSAGATEFAWAVRSVVWWALAWAGVASIPDADSTAVALIAPVSAVPELVMKGVTSDLQLLRM